MITVTRRTPRPGWTRYDLSNGWFIDAAKTAAHGEKYSLWEPGGDPSGCAAPRGGGPTLALALAVANGATLCARSEWGCRKVATCYATLGAGFRVYHCDDHRQPGDVPVEAQ